MILYVTEAKKIKIQTNRNGTDIRIFQVITDLQVLTTKCGLQEQSNTFCFLDLRHRKILFALKIVCYPKLKYNVIFIIWFSGPLNPFIYLGL